MKTIKQIADELQISRQAVIQRLNKLPEDLKPQKINGKYLIDEDVERLLIDSDKLEETTIKQMINNANDSSRELDFLKQEIENKNKQIDNLQTLLTEQQTLLNQQQQLQLQTQQLLISSQEKVKMLEHSLEEVRRIELPEKKEVEKEIVREAVKDDTEKIQKIETNDKKIEEKSTLEKVETDKSLEVKDAEEKTEKKETEIEEKLEEKTEKEFSDAVETEQPQKKWWKFWK